MLWLVSDAASSVQQLNPPDWAGWGALLLGPYPLTIYLLVQNWKKDQMIADLNQAAKATGEKTLDALLRSQSQAK